MKFWDMYSSVYDALPRFFGAYQRLVEDVLGTVEEAVPAGSRILDAGCGTGNFSVELGRKGYSVEGIDYSEGMLKRAIRKSSAAGVRNVEFKAWDIESGLTCYGDGTFDCVLSVHALYALREPKNAIAEYQRVLKPGGRLVLAEPQHAIKVVPAAKEIFRDGGLSSMARLAVTQFAVGLFNVIIGRRFRRGSYHRWDSEELAAMLQGAGFSVDVFVPAYATNSLLLTCATKPRFRHDMGGYRFRSAENPTDLQKISGLRYQVYALELGIMPEGRDGVERDEHDLYGRHFMALDGDGRLVAILRAVWDNPLGFPMDCDFPLTEYVRARGITGAMEVGSWVMHKDVGREDHAIVALGLFKCLLDYCNERGTRDVFCTTWPELADKYEMLGLARIGEPFMNSRIPLGESWQVPMHVNTQEAAGLLAGLPRRRPVVEPLLEGVS